MDKAMERMERYLLSFRDSCRGETAAGKDVYLLRKILADLGLPKR